MNAIEVGVLCGIGGIIIGYLLCAAMTLGAMSDLQVENRRLFERNQYLGRQADRWMPEEDAR